ncbi:hypothetical protein FHS29_002286 [Saccharothrix tamanrassetensis]|uniref:Uncharacterized protein n=1 Tax=Saccharothrix tamanrassetensis TaxID=1051531 RepID=A0A841CI71_9PSEU|nr:hypothetical protein [Saccharothrix tamanrassetensis]MBB5955705.1 hypothetical protein [Saccharothrix tamanrassetensis]
MTQNEEPARARRRFTERLACTLLFTVVQLWSAAVIVTQLETSGIVALAVALVLAGGLVAVADAWREVRSDRRQLDDEIREDLVRL